MAIHDEGFIDKEGAMTFQFGFTGAANLMVYRCFSAIQHPGRSECQGSYTNRSDGRLSFVEVSDHIEKWFGEGFLIKARVGKATGDDQRVEIVDIDVMQQLLGKHIKSECGRDRAPQADRELI